MSGGMMKAVVYVRVSTEDQKENGTSLATQELACLRKAADLSFQVVGVFRDEGVSGGQYLSRFGLQQAIETIENQDASTLIVYDITRLSRDAEHHSQIKKRIKAANGRIVFCTQEFADTADGELQSGIFAQFAQWERQKIRERTTAGSREKAKKGIQPSRRSPFGYHIINRDDIKLGRYPLEMLGKYIIIEEQAKWVRKLFQMYADGETLRGLARFLMQNEVPAPRGDKLWYRHSIQALLGNPAYIGKPTYGRMTVKKTEFIREDGTAHKHIISVPCDDPSTIITLSAPPIVDEATFEACQERRNINKQLGGNPERKYLLSGMLRCPACGGYMSGRRNRVKNRAFYHCRLAASSPDGHLLTCVRKQYNVKATEETILLALMTLACDSSWFQEAITAFEQHHSHITSEDKETIQMKARLSEIEREEKVTVKAQVEALMKERDASAYDRLLGELNDEKMLLKARLATTELQMKKRNSFDPKTFVERHEAALQAVAKVLTADDVMTVAERNRVLASMIKAITPSGEGFEIQTVQYGKLYLQVPQPVLNRTKSSSPLLRAVLLS